ncbi:exported hypothetical protein [uncultured Mycobacterium sp.]|uniref:DUF4189 domain-containing protein n=1 Tax=uncultured Mycobacterium sp. TaxID=171292 RepID=A0A1Y5NZM6_9MYCO|nr:exported hypothetical protein [uncultured Mycobacterium sp.]
MKITRIAAGVAAGIVAAGGSLVVSPAAQADFDFECKPGCWGAAAASTSTGQEVMRLNYETRQDAEDAAELWCDVKAQTNDCQVLASGLGCLSIAVSPDGKSFAGGNALFQDAADAAALNAAGPGSGIDLRDCNG